MILTPTEQEAENIRCDIIGAARRGEDSSLRMLALFLKRIGMKDYLRVLRDYIMEWTNWHYQDGRMTSSDQAVFRSIENNLR